MRKTLENDERLSGAIVCRYSVTSRRWPNAGRRLPKAIMECFLLIAVLWASSLWALPQNGQNQQPPPPPSGQNQQQQGNQQQQQQNAGAAPAPLFQGQSTLKSSRQGKETATAGFNGIGPDGSLQSAMLKANPTPADAAHIAAMASTVTDPAAVAAFDKEGNLNPPKGTQ
ncbi:MAG TPA: hypothetical protein VN682_00560 [Terriglobales bacterium]|nr:hypothetical protein [Terriglobales bacterium]